MSTRARVWNSRKFCISYHCRASAFRREAAVRQCPEWARRCRGGAVDDVCLQDRSTSPLAAGLGRTRPFLIGFPPLGENPITEASVGVDSGPRKSPRQRDYGSIRRSCCRRGRESTPRKSQDDNAASDPEPPRLFRRCLSPRRKIGRLYSG
jgi:hypothetical protein